MVGQPGPCGLIQPVVEQALLLREGQAQGNKRNEEAPQATAPKTTEAPPKDGTRAGQTTGTNPSAP